MRVCSAIAPRFHVSNEIAQDHRSRCRLETRGACFGVGGECIVGDGAVIVVRGAGVGEPRGCKGGEKAFALRLTGGQIWGVVGRLN